MQGREFISVASTWCVLTSSTEPSWRSSISRAYYGAMHHCREFLSQDLKLNVPGGPTQHELIPRALSFSKAGLLIEASDKLIDLRNWRRRADYELHNDKAGKQALAKQAIEQAKSIESAINTLKTSQTLNSIQKSISEKFSLTLPGWSIKQKLT